MKIHKIAGLAALALLITVALPIRAHASEWWRHHHAAVPVPAYTVPAYRVAPSLVTVPSMVSSYPAVTSYAAVPSYGVAAPVVPYGYHLSKHQMAKFNNLGRMERYAATHPYAY